MAASNTNLSTHEEKNGWFSAIFSVLILVAVSIYLLVEIALSVNQLINISERPLYLVGSHNLLPLFFLIPGVLYMTVVIIYKRLSNMNTKMDKSMYQFLFYSFILFVVSRIFYGGFFINDYMASHGYSYCNPLTSVSAFSPQIWVSDPGYCLEASRNVSSEVQDWLDAQMTAGVRPTPEEAEQKIKQLAQAYQARFNRF
ncbi:hypothetical protein [Alkalimonas sp.]|uniref:hypothetical protein n=1 Tax=Alkalimonas sp. TaxID=1872453 RepID=UPI00263B1B0D|nr:hypothetical protein [Alkalimonas sp.]MCC5826905.1 DUF1240 domain-containing protein [Alkalimonas sp.]